MTITFEDVLDLMPIAAPLVNWHMAGFQRDNSIDGRCPMCALAKAVDPSYEDRANWAGAASLLGIPRDVARRIADAADYWTTDDFAALSLALKKP